MDGPHPPQCGHWGAYPYPLCRCATSSLPLLAFGHFPPDMGNRPLDKGSRPPRGRLTDGNMVSPLRRIQKPHLLSQGPVPKPARDYGPVITCSSRPGAVRKPHLLQFSTTPGPSGPGGNANRHSDSARRKFCKIHQVRVPRNRGLGESRHWRTQFASAASPSVFWFLFHVEKELAAGAAKLPESPKNTHPADTSLRVRCRTDRAKNIKI